MKEYTPPPLIDYCVNIGRTDGSGRHTLHTGDCHKIRHAQQILYLGTFDNTNAAKREVEEQGYRVALCRVCILTE